MCISACRSEIETASKTYLMTLTQINEYLVIHSNEKSYLGRGNAKLAKFSSSNFHFSVAILFPVADP